MRKKTNMKNYDIERILKPAFKLFLMYNYEGVSTSKLEAESGLTRGAIFFKYKTKEDLFKAVIDKYVFTFQSSSSDLEIDTLKDFIDLYLIKIENRMKEMHSLGIENIHRGYFNLLYQALKFYPDFDRKITELFDRGLRQWERIVQRAKKSGEIKSSCDTHEIAQTFRCIYSGMSFENSLNQGLSVEKLRVVFYSYYREIANGK